MNNTIFTKSEKLQQALSNTDNIELIQLSEMLKMQADLDLNIFQSKGITEYPLYSTKISLITELGELLQEIPASFKYWKTSAQNNMDNALGEYVDVVHFALSLTNYMGETKPALKDTALLKYVYGYSNIVMADNEMTPHNLYNILAYIFSNLSYRRLLLPIFRLGHLLGFTWEDIYNGYKLKNSINHTRVETNY